MLFHQNEVLKMISTVRKKNHQISKMFHLLSTQYLMINALTDFNTEIYRNIYDFLQDCISELRRIQRYLGLSHSDQRLQEINVVL